VRGGDLSERVPLVGNWSEMLPTSQKQNVLPVMVLAGVLSLLVLNLVLHVVNGVKRLCLVSDLAVKGAPNPGSRQ
jgi:hypothetical protein